MDFYTLDYIVSHQNADSTRRVVAIIILLLVALVFSVLYLRDKARTRWRDAGVGLLVLSLVLLGIQTEQYLQVSNQLSQSQRLVHFVEGLATDHGGVNQRGSGELDVPARRDDRAFRGGGLPRSPQR